MSGAVTFAEEMARLEAALTDLFVSVTAELRPVMDEFSFAMQAVFVDYLLSEPWYRHLRMRWSLNFARRWTDRPVGS